MLTISQNSHYQDMIGEEFYAGCGTATVEGVFHLECEDGEGDAVLLDLQGAGEDNILDAKVLERLLITV